MGKTTAQKGANVVKDGTKSMLLLLLGISPKLIYWEITRTKVSKKRFGRTAIFHSKKIIGRNPKEFKEVFGQKHPNTKSYQFLLGKSRQKETLKKQCGRTACFPKKNPHWREVPIKSSSKIIRWRIALIFPQQRKLMGSSAQISSGVCRCGSQEQVPEGSGEFRSVLV